MLLYKFVVFVESEVSALLDTARETPSLFFNRSCRGPAARARKFVEIQFGVVCSETEDHPSSTFIARGTFDQANGFGVHAVSIWQANLERSSFASRCYDKNTVHQRK